ncbi:MAG: translation initiation factor IF-2 [Candidatus Vogelbacteria bacterium]|nr:translation initiation factor IF-2 [Candidatus Vogelbacteria bacterium]
MIKEKNNLVERAPVVAVMGHIDHGKSTLLDFIRNTKTVDKEAGGITQHIGAYEVVHEEKSGGIKKTITFLDTPGHEAFSKMRMRGANVADIVILVVAADDGVKPQTLEAFKTIERAKVPYIVAINKIDKPGANIEKTKIDLSTAGIYLEGLGGTVPFVPISAERGDGIALLLEVILLVAEVAELKKDISINAEGYVIESNLDPKKGGSATLIIKNGRMRRGDFVIIGKNIANARSVENSYGKQIMEAEASSPIRVIGWSEIAQIGEKFLTARSKKDAEEIASKYNETGSEKDEARFENAKVIIPIVLKADVSGSLEAIEKELLKLETVDVKIKFIVKGVGNISENDIKTAVSSLDSIVIGFNVKIDNGARDIAEHFNVTPQIFKIIYEISPVLKKEIENKTPKVLVEEIRGVAKILKTFSRTKDKQIVGGIVLDGKISVGTKFRLMRQKNVIDQGEISELQQQKARAKEVDKGNQFGLSALCKNTIAEGDLIEVYEIVSR